MQVVTIDSEVWKMLQYQMNRLSQQVEEMGKKEADKIFTIDQAADYLGVDRRWVSDRKKAFGCFMEGRVIRIRKSAIDKYLEKHTILKK